MLPRCYVAMRRALAKLIIQTANMLAPIEEPQSSPTAIQPCLATSSRQPRTKAGSLALDICFHMCWHNVVNQSRMNRDDRHVRCDIIWPNPMHDLV